MNDNIDKGGFAPQPISQAVVHFSEYEKYGCPVCKSGETKASALIQTAGCTLASCGHCGVAFLVCNDELETVPARLVDYNEMRIPEHPLSSQSD